MESFEICSKLTIKTLKRLQWRRSGVFIVNFIFHVSIVDFKHVNVSREAIVFKNFDYSHLLTSVIRKQK